MLDSRVQKMKRRIARIHILLLQMASKAQEKREQIAKLVEDEKKLVLVVSYYESLHEMIPVPLHRAQLLDAQGCLQNCREMLAEARTGPQAKVHMTRAQTKKQLSSSQ